MPESNASRCLVVDDEPRLRRVLVRLLEGEGFICREAGSGTEALELMQAEPAPLVISDLRMPEMDGVALLREIIARWPDTAVIMVTAVAEVESAVACLQLGALDYVAKPFHLDEVRARVMQALDKRRLKTGNRRLPASSSRRASRSKRAASRSCRSSGSRPWSTFSKRRTRTCGATRCGSPSTPSASPSGWG